MKKAATKISPKEQLPSPDLLEPAFYLSECRSLQIETKEGDDKAADYLARGVARTPANLIAQIQRINIYLAQRNADAAYGALLDLFIAVGDKGLSIRRRMLIRARSLLSKEQFQALALHLDSGISANDPMPLTNRSVLSKGMTGTRQLVVRINSAETIAHDPLQCAIEHLEYSQVDKARDVLEQALINDPARKELHSNLLAIYQASDDLSAFSEMHNKLDEMENPVPEEWERLARHFAG